MSETSPRRRLLGRTLVAAGALALPLTASISYAAAQVAPAPPAAEAPPAPPAPATPSADDGEQRQVRTFALRREGPDGEPVVRHFSWRGPQAPQGAQHWPQGEWDSEEFQRSMEEFQAEMEKFRAEWAEQHGEEWARWAEQAREHGERAARMAPVVVHDCDEQPDSARVGRTEDGRQRIVICDRQIQRIARSSLRNARQAIANNREISDEVRREVLEDLDQEIERIERDEG